MRKYELIPTDGRKSFYGKAVVFVDDTGAETLYSYGTKIITRTPGGSLVRFWGGWSQTTGRHIKAFCNLSKKEYECLPLDTETSNTSGGRTLTNNESYAAMMNRRAHNGAKVII